MNTAIEKPWFSEGNAAFKGKDPCFFDPDQFDWVKKIEENWTDIRDEMMTLLTEQDDVLKPYANKAMVSRTNKWKTFGLMFWTFKDQDNIAKCPKTWALIKDVPNLTAASFNLLDEKTTIKPHRGDTNAIVRCHMGISVPDSAPKCAFRVGSETRSWENGKFFMFCDAHEHTAWNNTDAPRYIMVLDVIRPEYVKKKYDIASRVLSSINLAVNYQNSTFLNKYFSGNLGKAVMLNLYRWLIRAMLTFKVSGKNF